MKTRYLILISLLMTSIANAHPKNEIDSISFQKSFSKEKDDLLFIEEVDSNVPLDDKIPLLLVHGWNPDPNGEPTGGLWVNIIKYIKNDLELSSNYKPYCVKYWSNTASVNELGRAFKIAMENANLHDKRVVIIAHSMGGLVSRSFMNEQIYTDGVFANKNCGDAVRALITLGTPHHGSPLANKEARDEKADFATKLLLQAVEKYAFNELSFDKPNRSDMLWDNFDNLFNYSTFSSEQNIWLSELNKKTNYDAKTTCYIGNINGEISMKTDTESVYKLGSYLIQKIFKFKNDGIVPYKSAAFEGHDIKKLCFFNNYNHQDMTAGKSADNYALFDSIKIDIQNYKPLRFISTFENNSYLRSDSIVEIKWEASSDDSLISIAFSKDKGATFEKLATIQAKLGIYSWQVPYRNADSCLLKIYRENAQYENSLNGHYFSICTYPKLKNHVDEPLSILPCFEFESNAGDSTLYQIDIKKGDDYISYSSDSNKICIPNKITDELLPGTEYEITAWEHHKEKSYSTTLTYRTETTAPYSFSIINPQSGITVNQETVEISWNRSIGTDYYNVVVINKEDTLLSQYNLSAIDTFAIVNMQGWHRADSIKIKIEAVNKYGKSELKTFFYNDYKTTDTKYENEKTFLANYPNPCSNYTYISFFLKKNSLVSLAIYDMNGARIAQLLKNNWLSNGKHQIMWKLNKQMKTGAYIIQLIYNGEQETQTMIIQ